MIKIVEHAVDGKMYINNKSAIAELDENNCTMPDIDRVIYNLGKKAYPKLDKDGKRIRKTDPDGKPIKQSKDPKKQLRDEEMFEMNEPVDVLATTVFFIDNTKVTVINSVKDGLEFEYEKMSDGSEVKVASRKSKEIGLIYAIVKRMISKPDLSKPGKMKCEGFGRMLDETIKDSYDLAIEKKKIHIAKEKSKAEHKRKLEEAKNNPKRKRYSIAETLERMNKFMDDIESIRSAAPDPQ